MNWIRENKFLTCFIAVLVIGAGVLGYLLFTAWGAYSDVSDQYTAEADALHQLQIRVPYPDQANLARYRAEIDDAVDATHTLASNLAQMVLPVSQITPSAFQDRLRDISSAIAAKAGKTGVKIPAHFALDFDQYQTQPPSKETVGPLGRQLEALNIAVNILIDEHVDEIAGLQRTRLPGEAAYRPGAGAAGSKFGQHGGLGGEPAEGAAGNLVEKFPFEVRFIASQPAFQKVLNDMAASSRQFFITRALVVENTNPKPVAKGTPGVGDNSAPPPAQMAAPASPAASGTNYLSFIVGTEKLAVGMQIDIATFNPPEKAIRKPAARPASH